MDTLFEVIQDNDFITVRFCDQTLFEGQLRPGLTDQEKHSAIVELQSECIAHLIHDAIVFGMAHANDD